MATIETVKKQDGSVVYPQTVYSAVCDSDGTTLAQDMSSVIHSQSVQSVEELPELLRDVKIGGTSVVEDGVANIPMASSSEAGLVQIDSSYGVGITSSNKLYMVGATTANIDAKTNGNRAIVPTTLDYAVMSGLANSNLTWTDTQQAAARNKIGAIGGKFELIDTITIETEVNTITKTAEPNGNNYNFGSVIVEINYPSGTWSSFNMYTMFFAGSQYSSCYASCIANATYAKRSTGKATVENGLLSVEAADITLSYGTYPNGSNDPSSFKKNANVLLTNTNINKIIFKTNNSSMNIASGVVIRIYAIRA